MPATYTLWSVSRIEAEAYVKSNNDNNYHNNNNNLCITC